MRIKKALSNFFDALFSFSNGLLWAPLRQKRAYRRPNEVGM
jgi:hypothetical protein